jgi:RHS repeat-associated protein
VGWSFDGIYRLTGETVTNDPTGDNGSLSYSLDPVGNRLSQASSLHNVPTVGFTYGPDDTLLSETYDGNGNVTATGGKTFSYDSQNELISANGGTVTVMYDGFGNRVSKTANGVTTKYLVDDLNPTGYTQVFDELTGSTVTRTYTYGLQRISENQVVDSVWTPSFYGYDGFGTVRQLTNTAGAVTDTFEYDAFGNAITHTGTTPNNYLYRGEQFDPDLGLYYLRARYYNPQTGRFMSRDPEDGCPSLPVTQHKYLYASGDPVDGLDPSGQDDEADYGRLLQIATAVAFGAEATTYTLQHTQALGSLQELGIEIACSLESTATKFGAYADLAIQYQGQGQVIQVGGCTWTFKPKKMQPRCNECDPPVGTFAYDLDWGQKRSHWFKGSKIFIPPGAAHWHLLQMNQSPYPTCQCFWQRTNYGGGFPPGPPPGIGEAGPPGGGGPAPE